MQLTQRFSKLLQSKSPKVVLSFDVVVFFALFGGLIPVDALAAFADFTSGSGQTNLHSMLVNLQTQLPMLFNLITAGAYFIGIMMGAKALYDLKQYGEIRTMMMSQTDARGPFTMLFVSGFLLYLPTALHISLKTLFDGGLDNILQYEGTSTAQGDQVIVALIQFVKLVGLISFVRGVLIIGRIGSKQQQGGGWPKALTHIVGGILAINIVGTMKIVADTFGLEFALSYLGSLSNYP